MAYSVKIADLEKDKDNIVSILERNRSRTDTDYAKRFDWIYLNNPFGRAKAWIIYNDKTGQPVGFTGVFPRPVFVDGKEYLAWNCGDFSIDKKYRALGVALKLRRAAKNDVDSGEVPFLYAHPNKRMEVVHLRVGHKKISEMKRFALPLKFNRYLKGKLPVQGVAPLIAMPFNAGLRFKYALKNAKNTKGRILTKVECHPEHETLFEAMKHQFRVIGVRNCKFIKWKFADHPNFKYQQFDGYRGNQLIGTLFFTVKDQVIHLIDVMVSNYQKDIIPLFARFISEVYKNKLAQTLSFILQTNNPIIPLLKEIGFTEREDATSSVIAYANEEKNKQIATVVLNGANWYMTVGDRDA